MLCSVLIPTRGRVEKLTQAIQSLYNSADPSRFEVLVRCDKDDEGTNSAIPDLILKFKGIKFLVGDRLNGWNSVSRFYTELSEKASGKFIWLFNDDVIVEGDWSNQLFFAPQAGVIIHPETYFLNHSKYLNNEGGAFPIIPNHCWKNFGASEIPDPPDTNTDKLLRIENGWKTFFLKDVIVRHHREIDSTLPKERF